MRQDDRMLRWGTAVFAAAFVAHNVDHLRRGVDSVTGEVKAGGAVVAVLAVTVITMVVTRHRLAARMAFVVGITTAVAVAASHLLPHWSAFSDSLPDGDVDAMTWAAALSEMGAGLVLAAAAANALWRPGRSAPGGETVEAAMS